MSKRRRFSDDFKAKIALEALRGDQTLSQIATRHKLLYIDLIGNLTYASS